MENNITKIIKNRRSISDFEDKEISKELLDEIIYLSSFAPSSTNTQPWFFLVFQTKENKQKLNNFIDLGYEKLKQKLRGKIFSPIFLKAIDAFLKYGKFDDAPVFILVFSRPYDKRGLSQLIDLSKVDLLKDIADESCKTSVAMAIQNLLLLAYDRGLGTRIKDGIKVFLDDEELKNQFYKEFKIDKDFKLVSGIQIGYPSEKSKKRQAYKRLPLSEISKYI